MSVTDYPKNHGSLAGLSGTDHHPQYALVVNGLASARPEPLRAGRFYMATDTATLSYDTGVSWIEYIRATSVADLEARMAMEVGP